MNTPRICLYLEQYLPELVTREEVTLASPKADWVCVQGSKSSTRYRPRARLLLFLAVTRYASVAPAVGFTDHVLDIVRHALSALLLERPKQRRDKW